jgi:hypothetical protein
MARPHTAIALLSACIAAGFLSLLGGCGTMSDDAAALMPQQGDVAGSMGDVREAWRGEGYPDLRTIPQVPEGLPDAAGWGQLNAGLNAAGASLNSDPRATLATELAAADVWAAPLRNAMAEDPRLGDPPVWMRDDRWYAQVLARMDALARAPR